MAAKKNTKAKKCNIKELTNGALILLIILSGSIGILIGWLLSYIF